MTAPDEERAAPTTEPAPAAQDGSPAQASTDDMGPLPDTGSAAMLPSGLALLAAAWLLARARPAFRTRYARMGQPSVNLDRALQLAGELEDDELVRKTRAGK